MLPIITQEFTLGSDPELRYTPSGIALCTMRAVASSRKKDDDGKWQDDKSSWVELTVWRQAAENCAESLTKGMKVIVIGKLNVEPYEDKDGNKKISVKVIVDAIGPSLAFATAKVTKAERSGASDSGGSTTSTNTGDDPWSTDAPASTTQSEEPPF